jgi:hypothetical protein
MLLIINQLLNHSLESKKNEEVKIMLRELQTVMNKNVDAQYKADEAMVTGMGVVKDYTNKTADFPAAETAEGIFFVNKERIPVGEDTGKGDLSDYHTGFVNVSADEFVKLITPVVGEVYGTDQFVAAGLTVGNAMTVGTNGKWIKGTAGKASRFIYTGTVSDN